MPDPPRAASALSPVLFALGDPDLLIEVLSSSPAGVVLVEATDDLPVVYCNEAFRSWAPLGRPVVGRPLAELFALADRAAVHAAYREVIRAGHPVHLRSAPYHENHRSDARVAHWNASHYPLRVPAGPVTHVLSMTVDVTDPVSARVHTDEMQQRVLRAVGVMAGQLGATGDAAAFFRGLSATIAELVSAERAVFLEYDAASQTLSAQPGGFGFAAAELERMRAIPCRPTSHSLIEQVVFGGMVVRDDGGTDGPDGSGDLHGAPHGRAITPLGGFGVRDTITVPWRPGKRRLGAVGACDSTRRSGFTDEDVWVLRTAVTAAAMVWEHRQADVAAAELRERESATLHQRIERTIQLEQVKANFLKLASHELRAPLAVVRGYVSMMEDGTLGQVGEQVAPVVPLLRAKLDEMNRLINEMLDTARIEEGALKLESARIDLRDVARDAVRSLEPLADERHSLVTSVPGRPVPVDGDRARLTMVAKNLVDNALKYSPRGGEVRVTCAAGDGRALLSVRDHGIGIAAQDTGRLFAPFGRIVNRQTAQITGVGLGLYLARDLARRHGGDVGVESQPGGGSTFTLTLPLAAG
jgi:signal transduction histidine kinase